MKLDKMGILDFTRGALSMSTVYLLLGMTVLFLVYDLWTHTYFWRMGIPGPRPFPVIGNLADYSDIPGALERYGKEYGPVVGFYFWRDPILVINDLDILRKLLIKDFGKFTNRRKLPLSSGVMDHMLFNLHSAQWKRVREILTPTFTGRKLKIMSDALNDCADVMVDSLRDACQRDGIIQCKDLYGGFVMDSVARCAFGLDVNSQKDPTHPFVTNAKRIFDPSSATPYFLAVSLIPSLKPFFELIGITFMPKDVIQFFTAVVKEAIALRKRPGAKQSADFLQLLIEAEVGTGELVNENDDDDMHDMHMNSSMERPSRAKGVSKKNLSEEELIAQIPEYQNHSR
ncbi:cytochrome P450 3A9-like [Diadema antillarum]|uniref:cytochrome P450 3A9-like n=1 Tax=Diadema antillarum TaxID=105358 RepID=UPI003A880FF7